MNGPSSFLRAVARIAWLAPILLFALTVYQFKTAQDLRATYLDGEPAIAEILALEISNRVDVTYDYVSLRIERPGSPPIIREKISLPHSLAPRLRGMTHIDVHVREEADQEIVIDALMPAHWHIAAGQAGISFVGFLLFGGGIYWWNRNLSTQEGAAASADPDKATNEISAPSA